MTARTLLRAGDVVVPNHDAAHAYLLHDAAYTVEQLSYTEGELVKVSLEHTEGWFPEHLFTRIRPRPGTSETEAVAPPFRPGDVVECIDDSPLSWNSTRLVRHEAYRVVEVTDDGSVRVPGSTVKWVPNRFRLLLREDTTEATEAPAPADPVNHPTHYRLAAGVEVITLTEQLDFLRGNAVKYLARAGRKDGADELEDLRKARWYVDRSISKLEKEQTA